MHVDLQHISDIWLDLAQPALSLIDCQPFGMQGLKMSMQAGDASEVFGGSSGDEEGGGRRQDLWHAHPRRHLPSMLPAGPKPLLKQLQTGL